MVFERGALTNNVSCFETPSHPLVPGAYHLCSPCLFLNAWRYGVGRALTNGFEAIVMRIRPTYKYLTPTRSALHFLSRSLPLGSARMCFTFGVTLRCFRRGILSSYAQHFYMKQYPSFYALLVAMVMSSQHLHFKLHLSEEKHTILKLVRVP